MQNKRIFFWEEMGEERMNILIPNIKEVTNGNKASKLPHEI